MKVYMIKNKRTGKIATFTTQSTADGEFCGDVEFTIEFENSTSTYDKAVWAVLDRKAAEKVTKENTPWYNAGKSTPGWEDSFKKAVEAGEVEIVEVEV